VQAAGGLQENRETAMRALDKFILSMINRPGKGTEKQREKDERRQPSAVRERPSDINSNGRQRPQVVKGKTP